MQTHFLCPHAVEMRALPSLPSPVLLLVASAILLTCCGDQLGYYPDEPYFDATSGIVDLSAVCPSAEVFRVRDICDVSGETIECIRKRCCSNYTYIAGRCIPNNVHPCSVQLCEQACQIQGDSVWCSCFPGYQFSSDNFMRKNQPFCVDINECASNNGGCQQVCLNDPGTFHCGCTIPYTLNEDGITCNMPMPVTDSFQIPLPLTRSSSRCYASCNTVSWLSKKVEMLSEQLDMMQKNYKKLLKQSEGEFNDAAGKGPMAYKVLDSISPILDGGYCRCERGPRGPTGPPGKDGPQGEEGPRGHRGPRGKCESTDLLLLLLADLRHDVMNIEAVVFRDGDRPPRLDLKKFEHQQKIDRKREDYAQQNLEATPPSGYEYYVETAEETPIGLTSPLQNKEPHTTTSYSHADHTSAPLTRVTLSLIEEQLRKLRLLASTTDASDEGDEDTDEDSEEYNFY